MQDEGNYDGPLGKEKHVFHRSRFCAEPESCLSASSMLLLTSKQKGKENP